MDATVLPEIFSLTLFIVSFQPLLRKIGADAKLWLFGWCCLLLHLIGLWIGGSDAPSSWLWRLYLAFSIELCALAFLAATANSANAPGTAISADQQLDPLLLAELAFPVLLESTLCLLGNKNLLLHGIACSFFPVALGHMLLTRERRRPLLRVAGAFAAFGLVAFGYASNHPAEIVASALCLIYAASAYLYAESTTRVHRGFLIAMAGLISAALVDPVSVAVHLTPQMHALRNWFDLPQYLIVAGVSLTLLEGHVLRTERDANHDPLTDLPNRRLFEERLIATMEEARAAKTTVACLVIDIDNFKTINDTLGHSAGDQLLRALAVRLSWHMSPRDILARTGGDEFTALLAGVRDEHHLRFIASAMMSAASVPIMIDTGPVDVHISVGIALSPDDADDIDSLRRAADEAMYSAKRRGGGMLAFAGEL